MTHSVDNSQVQSSIQEAVDYLSALPAFKDEVSQSKRVMLKEFLSVFKAYSASGNDIPCLRGMGLEQVLTICTEVIAGKYDNDFRLDFKSIAFAILNR